MALLIDHASLVKIELLCCDNSGVWAMVFTSFQWFGLCLILDRLIHVESSHGALDVLLILPIHRLRFDGEIDGGNGSARRAIIIGKTNLVRYD